MDSDDGKVDRSVAGQTPPSTVPQAATRIGLDLYWIPLGAGHHVVRMSGKIYEAITAAVQHRPGQPLFHSALVAVTPEGSYVIEVTEIRDALGRERGVVAEGPVGTGWLGQFRLFRYEVRRWLDGVIPDLSYAVGSPVRISDDLQVTRQVLELVPSVPIRVWGRDELGVGDMWNSNSVTSWLLTCVDLHRLAGAPPVNGRAPGWAAGVLAARREVLQEVA